ncbi:hypothetical protein PGTUg99_025783 [Puccinia graminis f. sp. tritici]|uniref:Uncharacterized protein n=1 Tax=Puccinia graminis f. sp. tritici TaxID=56615 RepID=A0A5B0SA43_PUCGR|nr:hypothetical protein PGTUg99_025783 [Puccinia graminis f. sp. tritici]
MLAQNTGKNGIVSADTLTVPVKNGIVSADTLTVPVKRGIVSAYTLTVPVKNGIVGVDTPRYNTLTIPFHRYICA